MEADTLRRRVEAARVATLATVDDVGRPHAVPVCFASLPDGRLVSAVDHKPKRTTALRRLDHVRAHPSVSLLVHHYDDNWESLWWVRADGTARVVDPIPGDGVTALAAKYPQYAARPPAGPAILIAVERWRGWSARP